MIIPVPTIPTKMRISLVFIMGDPAPRPSRSRVTRSANNLKGEIIFYFALYLVAGYAICCNILSVRVVDGPMDVPDVLWI